MSESCGVDGCDWKILTDDSQEALVARCQHLREAHFSDPEREFEGGNLELIAFVHDALHAIDTDELNGWYSSQIDRMRGDACEIMGVHDDDHERTAVAIDHSGGETPTDSDSEGGT